jgi:hypothetical protein
MLLEDKNAVIYDGARSRGLREEIADTLASAGPFVGFLCDAIGVPY